MKTNHIIDKHVGQQSNTRSKYNMGTLYRRSSINYIENKKCYLCTYWTRVIYVLL